MYWMPLFKGCHVEPHQRLCKLRFHWLSFHCVVGFLRKVYGILSAQLLVTLLVGVLFITIEPLETFVKQK